MLLEVVGKERGERFLKRSDWWMLDYSSCKSIFRSADVTSEPKFLNPAIGRLELNSEHHENMRPVALSRYQVKQHEKVISLKTTTKTSDSLSSPRRRRAKHCMRRYSRTPNHRFIISKSMQQRPCLRCQSHLEFDSSPSNNSYDC